MAAEPRLVLDGVEKEFSRGFERGRSPIASNNLKGLGHDDTAKKVPY
jgi:hypothetical protein